MDCPVCHQPLANRGLRRGIAYRCPSCGGQAVGVALLQKVCSGELVRRLWVETRKRGEPSEKKCPSCGRPMSLLRKETGDGSIELDVCITCHLVWLDAGELESLPPAAESSAAERAEPARLQAPMSVGASFGPEEVVGEVSSTVLSALLEVVLDG